MNGPDLDYIGDFLEEENPKHVDEFSAPGHSGTVGYNKEVIY